MKSKRSKLFLQLGLSLLLLTMLAVQNNLESIKWLFVDHSGYQKAPGLITKSEIGRGGAWRGWRFYIEYEYTVDNKLYSSERVHFGFQESIEYSYAKGYTDKYPVNSKVLVFYDPNSPEISVLEPDVRWLQPIYVIFGNIIIVFLLIIFSIKDS